jgi:hypothetical protein
MHVRRIKLSYLLLLAHLRDGRMDYLRQETSPLVAGDGGRMDGNEP